MWRSSFLHHGNRCSCFHWPGASLTLLAVVLLLACCGGQPAGRYTAHSPGGGGGGGFFLSLAAQHLGLSVSCPPYPPGETGNCPPQSEPGSSGNLLGQLLSEAEGSGEGSVGPWVGWAAEHPHPAPARTPRTPSPLTASRGVELGNACALFLLLLLNLILTGRQDRLKRREVERRLRGVIGQIQGEAGLGADLQRGQCGNEGRGLMQDFRGSEENRPGSRGACWIWLVCAELRVRLCPTFHLHQMPSGMARRSSGQMPCTQTSTCRSHHPGLCTGPIEMDISSTCRSACWWKETS